MAAMTDYLANALRDHTLRNTAYTSPTTVYLALFTTATTEAGGGTEMTGGSYARQAITFDAGAIAGQADQATLITFTDCPAATVVAGAVMDALTAGNMLYHGRFPAQRALVGGEPFNLLAGDLKILID
jgi:hypothetical protein